MQLVKKFPAFHGTRRFIAALTSVRHLSLSWASPIQSIYPHPTSLRSILILSTHLRLGLPSGLFPSGFPTRTLYTPSPHQYAPHAQPISFFSILSPAQYWVSSTNPSSRIEKLKASVYCVDLQESPAFRTTFPTSGNVLMSSSYYTLHEIPSAFLHAVYNR